LQQQKIAAAHDYYAALMVAQQRESAVPHWPGGWHNQPQIAHRSAKPSQFLYFRQPALTMTRATRK